jgi:putative intracellular protease/amidase
LGNILKEQEKAGRLIASICAGTYVCIYVSPIFATFDTIYRLTDIRAIYALSGPTALKQHEICLGKSLTSYPTVKDKMTEGNKYTYKEERVVVDGVPLK